MVTGRDLFGKVRGLLLLMAVILRLLPRPLAKWLWCLSGAFPGKVGAGLRYSIAVRLGATLGRNVLFGPGVFVDGWENLILGDNVSVHRNCYLDARGRITIGNNVSIAHDCSLISFEHSIEGTSDIPIKYLPLIFAPIVIQDDVWLGCAVRVLAGSNIGCRSVIGAGAVIKGGIEGMGVWAGVPGKLIRTLEPPRSSNGPDRGDGNNGGQQ